MKFLTVIAVLFLLSVSAHGQDISFNKKTRIYVVRHAEKEGGKDPVLTNAGKQRAGDLMRKLANKNIQRIYVSEYRRTQMTGDSMRIQSGIDTVHYVADTVADDLLRRIKEHGDIGKNILVIGHSNTIPYIIRKLGVKNYPKENIPDNEFDNLFLVTVKRSNAKLVRSKYGALSGVSAGMQPGK